MNDRDKQWIGEMTKEHPTPFFVLFSRVPQARYFELVDSFRNVAKELRVCYSVKTNPHPKILDALAKMESGFEVVSERELNGIESLSGFKVFNSIAPSDEELLSAVKQNALIMIDSLSVAERLARLPLEKPLKVGLRVRFDTHRFGVAPQEVKEMVDLLHRMQLQVVCLHAHPGTNLSLSTYRNFVSRLAALANDLPFLESIDLGGGFPGKTALMERKETLEQYAGVIREQLGDFLRSRTLILESGRFLVEDSMLLVVKVRHVKQVDGQWFAMVDAGINALPRLTMSPFRFFALTETGPKKTHFRLGGPLMFGTDEVGQLNAALASGDVIAIENTGAYCTELGWNLSFGLPKIVCIE